MVNHPRIGMKCLDQDLIVVKEIKREWRKDIRAINLSDEIDFMS